MGIRCKLIEGFNNELIRMGGRSEGGGNISIQKMVEKGGAGGIV